MMYLHSIEDDPWDLWVDSLADQFYTRYGYVDPMRTFMDINIESYLAGEDLVVEMFRRAGIDDVNVWAFVMCDQEKRGSDRYNEMNYKIIDHYQDYQDLEV